MDIPNVGYLRNIYPVETRTRLTIFQQTYEKPPIHHQDLFIGRYQKGVDGSPSINSSPLKSSEPGDSSGSGMTDFHGDYTGSAPELY